MSSKTSDIYGLKIGEVMLTRSKTGFMVLERIVYVTAKKVSNLS